MLSPLLTLVADAYPLIWPTAAVALVPIRHWLVPGCWFSITIGLLWAAALSGDSPIPQAAAEKTNQRTPAYLDFHIAFSNLGAPTCPSATSSGMVRAIVRQRRDALDQRSKQFDSLEAGGVGRGGKLPLSEVVALDHRLIPRRGNGSLPNRENT